MTGRTVLGKIAVLLTFVVLAMTTTAEGAFAVLFGWIPFLGRVGPQVTADTRSTGATRRPASRAPSPGSEGRPGFGG